MPEASRFQFTDAAVPRTYDDFLVPRMFEPWGRLLVDEARLQGGEAVLDVATGPGTVARLAAQRLGPRGRVVGVDISRPMLEVARAKPPLRDAASIEYVESPAAPLNVADGVFDVVLCQQGVQFFPDRLAALREMRRALKPGGRLAIAVWAPIEQCAIYAALHASLRDAVPRELADLLLAPFSWGDPAELARVVSAVGLRDVQVQTRRQSLSVEGGVEQVVRGCIGSSPLAPGVAELPEERRAVLMDAARKHLAGLVTGSAVRGDMVANVVLAQA
jgi:ubiquinone/menaquinone biosynthesis C-methylase UbiE